MSKEIEKPINQDILKSKDVYANLICTKGNSKKFYTIYVLDKKVIVHHGRIGTKGRVALHMGTFVLNSGALIEAQKLSKTKQKKGYQIKPLSDIYFETTPAGKPKGKKIIQSLKDIKVNSVSMSKPKPSRMSNITFMEEEILE